MSFYVDLLSNASTNYYSDNTLSHFSNFLPEQVNLNGDWEVALTEIYHPNYFENVTDGVFYFGAYDEKNLDAALKNPATKSRFVYKYSIQPGIYKGSHVDLGPMPDFISTSAEALAFTGFGSMQTCFRLNRCCPAWTAQQLSFPNVKQSIYEINVTEVSYERFPECKRLFLISSWGMRLISLELYQLQIVLLLLATAIKEPSARRAVQKRLSVSTDHRHKKFFCIFSMLELEKDSSFQKASSDMTFWFRIERMHGQNTFERGHV